MDYYKKYLKYKLKYLNLSKQTGGSLDKSLLFFQTYRQNNFSNPKEYNTLLDILQEPTDLEDCLSVAELQNIFPKICRGVDNYDKSTTPSIIFEYDKKISEYLNLSELYSNFESIIGQAPENFKQFLDASFNLGMPANLLSVSSQLHTDYNNTMSNDVEIKNILDDVLEYLDIEVLYKGVEQKIFYNEVQMLYDKFRKHIHITDNESESVKINDKPVKIWKINTQLYFYVDDKYYEYSSDSDAINIYICNNFIKESKNNSDVLEGTETVEKEMYCKSKEIRQFYKITDNEKYKTKEERKCLYESEEAARNANYVNQIKKTVMGKYDLYIKAKEITNEGLIKALTESRYSYVASGDYGEGLTVIPEIKRKIYTEYGFTKESFEELREKVSNTDRLEADEKEKISKIIIKYLVLNHDYGVDGYSDSIWTYLKKQDLEITRLNEVLNSLITEINFKIKDRDFLTEEEKDYFQEKIINEHKSDLNKLMKHWFKFNNLDSLLFLLKNDTKNYDPNSFSQATIEPNKGIEINDISYHLGFIILMEPISMIGGLAHELGHNIFGSKLKKPFLDFFKKYYKNDENYFAGHAEKSTYNEFIADIFSVLCLDKYLEKYTDGMTNEQKFEIIDKWFLVFCNNPANSKIIQGHPEHSFRINTLLISKRVYKIICSKLKK
jgi:hypothetical protein